MLLADFLSWWYSRGWAWCMHQYFGVYVLHIADLFSIQELSKTLFAPFRQDVLSTANAPIGVKLQALGGNIVSRFFGFIVRSILILTGCIVILMALLLGVVFVALWPLLPLAAIALPLLSSLVVQ